jgi:ABC-2 type transport system permease protein
VFSALWMLVLAVVGLVLVGGLGLDPARYTVVAAGAVLTLGWVIGPVFAAGIDTTLDPAKLAPFPMTTATMMRAITAGGLTGIPGIATALGALATFAVWWRWPLAALAAAVCVPLGVLICVVASRTVASLATGLGGKRRARELIALIAFGLVVFASPLLVGLLTLARSAVDSGAQLIAIVEGVSWTPIAAAWAVPGDVAAGNPLAAGAKLAIALGTLAVLWLIWQRSLAASLVAPPARSAARGSKAGSLGLFGVLPSTPAGATWARSLTYWLHDLRYSRQLLFVPFAPILVLIYTQWDISNPWFVVSGLVAAFFVGVVPYTDVSYDGTAFATVLQTGIRGRDDRLGRMLGAATVGTPLVLLVCVVTVAIAGRWDTLPAVVGASILLLLAGYGVSAVTSAMIIVPTPAPGDSPFKRVPGSTFGMVLVFLACWLIVVGVSTPAIVPALFAIFGGSSLAGWIALAVGVVLGPVLFAVGVAIGGRRFDVSAPRLLVRLQALKGT